MFRGTFTEQWYFASTMTFQKLQECSTMEKRLLFPSMTQSEVLKVMFIQKARIRKKNRKILHVGSTLMRAIFCGSSSVIGVYLTFSDK